MKHAAIGIDLGTTYCAVATIDEFGKPKMLLNRDGSALTPSVVQLGEGGNAVVGEAAKNSFAFEPANTAMFFKINMGEANWVRTVAGKQYDATRLSAYLLRRLKEDAETELGRPVTKVVVTVPAYFNDAQRVATKQAAEIAGLEVLRLINEPTAAAIDYGRDTATAKNNRTIFVFDLGGGTLDATILRIEHGEFRVLHTAGLHDLGGIHWDQLIVDMVRERFTAEHGIDIGQDAATVADAVGRAETAKKALSQKDEVTVQVGSAGKRVSFKVTRADFERAADDLVRQCRDLVLHVLEDAKLSPAQIDEVLMVGGATRMPMIRDVVRTVFGKEPVQSTRVDESVARGAAYVAYEALRESLPAVAGEKLVVEPLKVTDVSTHSLGTIYLRLPSRARYNAVLIPRFSPLPASKLDTAGTVDDNQTAVLVEVTEGESAVPDECDRLGEIELPIPPRQRAGYQIEIRYEYDSSGMLHAVVTDPKTGERREAYINSPLRMSTKDLRSATRELAVAQIE